MGILTYFLMLNYGSGFQIYHLAIFALLYRYKNCIDHGLEVSGQTGDTCSDPLWLCNPLRHQWIQNQFAFLHSHFSLLYCSFEQKLNPFCRCCLWVRGRGQCLPLGPEGVSASGSGGVCRWVQGMYTPLGRHQPPADILGRHPSGRHPLPPVTATAADGTHPIGMHSCFNMQRLSFQLCGGRNTDVYIPICVLGVLFVARSRVVLEFQVSLFIVMT